MKKIVTSIFSLFFLFVLSLLFYLAWILNKGEFKSQFLEEFLNNRLKKPGLFYSKIENPAIQFDKKTKKLIMKYLITGVAGFIGFHLTKRLLSNGYHVVGVDNMNDYYDPSLKELRLGLLRSLNKELNTSTNFEYFKEDVSNKKFISHLFENKDDHRLVFADPIVLILM